MAKIVAKQRHVSSELSGIHKDDVTGRKQDRYKSVTWDWLLKYIPRDQWKKYQMGIEVTVWNKHDNQQNRGLAQEFLPSDLKHAMAYAKKLIEDGTAVLTSVRGSIKLQSGYGKTGWVDFCNWEPEDTNESKQDIIGAVVDGEEPEDVLDEITTSGNIPGLPQPMAVVRSSQFDPDEEDDMAPGWFSDQPPAKFTKRYRRKRIATED